VNARSDPAGLHAIAALGRGQSDYASRLLEVPALHRDGRTVTIAFRIAFLRDSQTVPSTLSPLSCGMGLSCGGPAAGPGTRLSVSGSGPSA
jgi:hypothetical protein